MDQATRNQLQRFAQEARRVLEAEFAQQLEGTFDILPNGSILPKPGPHLDETQILTRQKLVDTVQHRIAGGKSNAEGVDEYTREAAFTFLNRLVALKMSEARGLVQQCISKEETSSGFKEFTGLAPGLSELPDKGYRLFLECLFDELSIEVKVLFDRQDPASLLWPRRQALIELLALINQEELEGVWDQDEAIGWVYQYFNSQEERRQMRDESSAPSNSRELAVRNQFFTPRYVVEFLTDNTLGRIWYEMRKGYTTLKEKCRYLVRRPNEVFLGPGEPAPKTDSADEALSQEELIKQAVYISHRDKKDPRDLKILDPACGSGHFLLYCFFLLIVIYEEAWADETSPASKVSGKTLRESYPTIEELRKAIPELILRHNVHGIDIDRRACQIASLALWLCAQRTWQQQGIRPAERPQIRRSNVVSGEPMPGEEVFLTEFIDNHLSAIAERRLLGQLVRHVFDAMKLAGEAGALLKIEEEIAGTVAEAKKAWLAKPAPEQGRLYSDDATRVQKKLGFDVSGITDETFWGLAEENIYASLQTYAERAENGRGYQRRLFADDAARGFAFIDLCRKRYDVVLMNPPFGASTQALEQHLANTFPNGVSANLICGFIHVCSSMLEEGGLCATVIDHAVLVRSSFERFRKTYLLDTEALIAAVEWGWGVLDANVEVSSIILQRGVTPGSVRPFGLDLSDSDDKQFDLLRLVQEPVDFSLSQFIAAPYCSINFRLPRFFKVARSLSRFDSYARFFNGHTIKSDVFKRLVWELPARSNGKSWYRLWNGSGYSPFYVPMQEGVLWTDYAGGVTNHKSTIIRSPNIHFKAGLCYGKRGDFLDIQVLPAGHVLTNEGFGGPFRCDDSIWYLLGYLNSKPVQYSLNLYSGQHKEVGYVNALPCPKCPIEVGERIAFLSKAVVRRLREVYVTLETDPNFQSISALEGQAGFFSTMETTYIRENRKVLDAIEEIDSLVTTLLGLTEEEREQMETALVKRPSFEIYPWLVKKDHSARLEFLASIPISYAVGVAFGRWDIRFATNERPSTKLPDVFSELPLCPPGMLQNEQGLPVTEEDVRLLQATGQWQYPLDIPWDGILVDDPGHPLDIESRSRDVLEGIWEEQVEAIQREALEILRVSTLRDYFRKPDGFFADHLKRYSKSRRKAPLYWSLTTPSSSYAVWLYYHRFSKDTFYKVLDDYVKPKFEHEERKLNRLRDDGGDEPSREQRQKVDEQEAFVIELKNFREEIERIAPLWNPDLNDGVMINFAPLWRLVPQHKAWQKECKECWDALLRGDYDWAHLAMHLWPERVVPKCQDDVSLAIAYGLGDVFWGQDAKGKWKKKPVSKARIEELIRERTKPAVKAALENLLSAPAPGGGAKSRKPRQR